MRGMLNLKAIKINLFNFSISLYEMDENIVNRTSWHNRTTMSKFRTESVFKQWQHLCTVLLWIHLKLLLLNTFFFNSSANNTFPFIFFTSHLFKSIFGWRLTCVKDRYLPSCLLK